MKSLTREDQVISFPYMNRRKIESIPEPFHTAMKTSRTWSNEKERAEETVTNCLRVHFPENGDEDAVIELKVGWQHGFHILNLFGLEDMT
jgi:hypothetical protein